MRGILTLIIPRARLAPILEDIRTKAGITNLIYWVESVEAFGRLALASFAPRRPLPK